MVSRLLSVALALAFVLALLVLGNVVRDDAIDRRLAPDDRSDEVTAPSPRVARVLSLGYNELFADLAWARTLIYYGDGMQRKTRLVHVERLLELVNGLDPQFRKPYWWGGYATTFRQGPPTQAEFRSSVAVLERAVTQFPTDWELHWLLGTRYFLDLKSEDPAEQARFRELGAAYIEKAMRLPDAPSDLPLLAASMRTKLGQRERALRALEEMILTQTDPEVRKQLEERYANLASEDAREALAEAAQEFQRSWFDNLPYAPPSLYILLGPRPAPTIDLDALARGDVFEADVPEDQVFP